MRIVRMFFYGIVLMLIAANCQAEAIKPNSVCPAHSYGKDVCNSNPRCEWDQPRGQDWGFCMQKGVGNTPPPRCWDNGTCQPLPFAGHFKKFDKHRYVLENGNVCGLKVSSGVVYELKPMCKTSRVFDQPMYKYSNRYVGYCTKEQLGNCWADSWPTQPYGFTSETKPDNLSPSSYCTGRHSCWSPDSIGHVCDVYGIFGDANEAYFKLKADDCCPGTTEGGISNVFNVTSCMLM